MCSCSQHSAPDHPAPIDPGVTLKVNDMTCEHCAATVTKAVESAIPGSKVVADPSGRLVSVSGTTDVQGVKALVAEAGYTPTEVVF